MVVVYRYILPHSEFWRNDHCEDAPHFINFYFWGIVIRIVLIEIIVTRWQKWRFQDSLTTVILNDEIMALNKIILVRFDLDFCNSTFSNRIDFPIWTWSLRKVHYHVHLIRFYSQRQLSKLILLIYKIIHTIGSFTTTIVFENKATGQFWTDHTLFNMLERQY